MLCVAFTDHKPSCLPLCKGCHFTCECVCVCARVSARAALQHAGRTWPCRKLFTDRQHLLRVQLNSDCVDSCASFTVRIWVLKPFWQVLTFGLFPQRVVSGLRRGWRVKVQGVHETNWRWINPNLSQSLLEHVAQLFSSVVTDSGGQ